MDHANQPGTPILSPTSGEMDISTTEARATSLTAILERLDEAVAANTPGRIAGEIAHQNRLVQVRLGIASSLFAALRAKHAPTAAHCLRVALGCSSWAMMLNLPSPQRDEIEAAALLHDIGKIG